MNKGPQAVCINQRGLGMVTTLFVISSLVAGASFYLDFNKGRTRQIKVQRARDDMNSIAQNAARLLRNPDVCQSIISGSEGTPFDVTTLNPTTDWPINTEDPHNSTPIFEAGVGQHGFSGITLARIRVDPTAIEVDPNPGNDCAASETCYNRLPLYVEADIAMISGPPVTIRRRIWIQYRARDVIVPQSNLAIGDCSSQLEEGTHWELDFESNRPNAIRHEGVIRFTDGIQSLPDPTYVAAGFQVDPLGPFGVDLQTSRNYEDQLNGPKQTASGASSTIAGGAYNSASGNYAVVGGGDGNTASGVYSTILGGQNQQVAGPNSTIVGGSNNFIQGNYNVILGGSNLTSPNATDSYQVAINGIDNDVAQNTLEGDYNILGVVENSRILNSITHSAIISGKNNTIDHDSASSRYNVILGGANNIISNTVVGGVAKGFNWIANGDTNEIDSSLSYHQIYNGNDQTISEGEHTTLINGRDNTSNCALGCLIFSGRNNTLSGSGQYNTIFSGHNSTASGSFNFLGVGDTLAVGGSQNAVMGGKNVTIQGGSNHFVGNLLSSTIEDTGSYNAIASGRNLTIKSGAEYSALFAGENNSIEASVTHSGVGIGTNNVVHSSDAYIAAGSTNQIASGAVRSFIGGGINNRINSSGTNSVILGGQNNAIDATNGFIGSGSDNQINHDNSAIPAGKGNKTTSDLQTVVGNYNADDASQAFFVVGNGTGEADRKTAMVVRKNGLPGPQTEIRQGLNVGETFELNSVSVTLENGVDMTLSNGNFNLTATDGDLSNNGNITCNRIEYTGPDVPTGCTPPAPSDRRLKRDLLEVDTSEILQKVLALNPVKFRFKEGGDISLGLIAQEVLPLFPELVNSHESASQHYHLDYSQMVPILMAALNGLVEKSQILDKKIRNLKLENQLLTLKLKKANQ